MATEHEPVDHGPSGSEGARQGGSPAKPTEGLRPGRPDIGPLSDEERMLVRVRDELYEGSWDQFVADLKARLSGRPHVFEIGPVTDRLTEKINDHLRIIKRLRTIETRSGVNLNGRH